MLTRPIPRTGETLPVIGLGTWQTFDVGDGRAPLAEVISAFLDAGGRVIDSSPMYGRAETVVGDLLRAAGRVKEPFLATKVWTSGGARGQTQMQDSIRKLGRVDLMQIHNLLDWKTHLPTMRAWKELGTFRYLGITHYGLGSFDEMEQILRKEKLDFIQLPYSVATRAAEKRLLPAAAETQTAVLVMRPFEEGELFARVKGKPVPDWAAEAGAASWAQLFLKFIVSHPAVTCVIPATDKKSHLLDNLAAGRGALPDDKLREKIARLV
jgi:diketogulonate reductase-like aldo/keto reductase